MPLIHWFLDDANRIVAFGTLILAIAALFQFELARRTARRQLRAYVHFHVANLLDGSNADPPPFVDRTDQPGVVILIKNTGQTPAENVLHWVHMEVATLDRDSAMNPPSKLDNISACTIPSQDTTSKAFWLNRALSPQEKDGIQNGRYAIFVYGRIEYTDVFKKGWWATYRLKYTSAAWPPYGNSGSMTFCDGGNSSGKRRPFS